MAIHGDKYLNGGIRLISIQDQDQTYVTNVTWNKHFFHEIRNSFFFTLTKERFILPPSIDIDIDVWSSRGNQSDAILKDKMIAMRTNTVIRNFMLYRLILEWMGEINQPISVHLKIEIHSMDSESLRW